MMAPPGSAFTLDDDDDGLTLPEGPARDQSTLEHAEPPGPNASTLLDAVRQAQENQQFIAQTEQMLQDLLQRATSLAQAQRLLEQQAVLATLRSAGASLGSHEGRPVAALLIHRCCLHWNTLTSDSPEAAALLDQILAVVASQATEEDDEQQQQQQQQPGLTLSPAMARLAYWLSTSATLLALVTKLAPAPQALSASHPGGQPHDSAPGSSSFSKGVTEMHKKFSSTFRGLFSKISKPANDAQHPHPLPPPHPHSPPHPHGEATTSGGAPDGASDAQSQASSVSLTVHSVSQLQAAQPAQAQAQQAPPPLQQQQQQAPVQSFRQQLALLTLRLYGLLRDQFKKQLAALLPACVQCGVGTAHGGASGLGSRAGSPRPEELQTAEWEAAGLGSPKLQSPVSVLGLGHAAMLRPFAELVILLSSGLVLLQEQSVPRIVIKCLMKQVLAFVDVQMFNQLLLRPECCSASNALYMSEGMAHLDAWLAAQASSPDTSYLATLQADLRHTRQALAFLVHPSKGSLTLHDITALCPSLSLQQLYRLLTTFWDDMPAPAPAPMETSPSGHPLPVSASSTSFKGEEPSAAAGRKAQATEETGACDAAAGEATGHLGDSTAAAPPGGDESKPAGQEGEAGQGGTTAAAAAAAVAAVGPPAAEEAAIEVVPSAASASTAEAAAPVRAMGMVSGEVLEELKAQSAVSSNGGLIVTFLLDEEHQPALAARGPAAATCAVAYEALALIDDTLPAPAGQQHVPEEGHVQGRLYLGMPVPPQLLSPVTPQEPFLFLEKDCSV